MNLSQLSLIILLFIGNYSLVAQVEAQVEAQTQETKPTKKPKKESLLDVLTTQTLPKIALEMDLKMLFDDRRMMNYQKAVASITFDDGAVWTDDIKLKTRGVFRSQKCDNPPLKLKYSKKGLKARKLNKNNELKLVYPCKLGDDFQKFVYKEYLIYKLNNILTEQSLRVQLIDLEIKDSLDNIPPITTKGFLIEHREELIHRVGAEMNDMRCLKPVHLVSYDYTLFQVFQYFIGNTDWLLPGCKNCEIIDFEDGKMIPIAYDFDFSGMVEASYAIPNSALPVKTITDRYFLGHKKKMEDLEPVFALFHEKKAELIQVVNDFEYLPKSERRKMVRYMESFYKILKKPKLLKKAFIHPMGDNMKDDY